mmetsp:Transcript_176454/g.565804  ORF Transcript_176454/g.565804 Transcript_176454/m.565804 type:complete len:85 (+) Transcript_176454:98-352(+)
MRQWQRSVALLYHVWASNHLTVLRLNIISSRLADELATISGVNSSKSRLSPYTCQEFAENAWTCGSSKGLKHHHIVMVPTPQVL